MDQVAEIVHGRERRVPAADVRRVRKEQDSSSVVVGVFLFLGLLIPESKAVMTACYVVLAPVVANTTISAH